LLQVTEQEVWRGDLWRRLDSIVQRNEKRICGNIKMGIVVGGGWNWLRIVCSGRLWY
jgi:hypothetical protein